MTNKKNGREEFAASLISLALVRNGYQVQSEIRFPGDIVADLVARKMASETDIEEVFAVEVKWVNSFDNISPSNQLTQIENTSQLIGMPVYLAFVKGDGASVKVDAMLKERMLYSDDDLNVSTVSVNNLRAKVKRFLG